MKLSEIEAAGYLLTAYDEEDVYEDGDINYDVFEFHRDNYTQNDLNKCGLTQWDFCDCQALYTAEQMQEYAKAQVAEAYQSISNYAMFAYLNNHEPIVPEAQEVINTIFEEGTKNESR